MLRQTRTASWRVNPECLHCAALRSDVTLTNLANALGVLSVVLIVVYQFFDVVERRQALAAVANSDKSQ
jgi:hypothetical protein